MQKRTEKTNNLGISYNTDDNSSVLLPRRLDILCGKDKVCFTHEGSRCFRAIIDLYRKRYQESSTKQEKMEITKEVFENIQCWGSRFLKFDSRAKSWRQINEVAARDKISHALRFANQQQEKQRKKMAKQKNSSPLSSSLLPSLVSRSLRCQIGETSSNAIPGSESVSPLEAVELFKAEEGRQGLINPTQSEIEGDRTSNERPIYNPVPFAVEENVEYSEWKRQPLWDAPCFASVTKQQSKKLKILARSLSDPSPFSIEEDDNWKQELLTAPIHKVKYCRSSSIGLLMNATDSASSESDSDYEAIMKEPFMEWIQEAP